MTDKPAFVEMTADIVSAYVSHSSISVAELPTLIQQVHRALADIASGAPVQEVAPAAAPAVSIKKSVTPDFLICLEDGRKFKSLKRHLRSQYGMSPEEYRAKWNLPRDYPMVAPNYAAARSELAKKIGLGQARRKGAAAKSAPRGGAKAAR